MNPNIEVIDFCHNISRAGAFMSQEEARYAGNFVLGLVGKTSAFTDPQAVYYNGLRWANPAPLGPLNAAIEIRLGVWGLAFYGLVTPGEEHDLLAIASRIDGRFGSPFLPGLR